MPAAEPIEVERELAPADYFRRLSAEALSFASGPLEIDLGCGDGEFLLEMAQLFPDRRFLAVERLRGRVRKVCRAASRAGLINIKVLRAECGYAAEYLLPHPCASAVHILFPDPWPKKRHESRRLVNRQFLPALAGVLVSGGDLYFKTDDEHYFQESCDIFASSGFLESAAWPLDVPYPETGFERLWLREGRTVHRAFFRRE